MKRTSIALIAAAIALLASCASPKTTGYLLDVDYENTFPVAKEAILRIQPGDVLSIQLITDDPALAAPFGSGAASGSTTASGTYLVDEDGNIDFPVLGKTYVAGESLSEIQAQLVSRIVNMGYIKHPTIKVGLDNFHITVLGTTNTVMRVADNKINILDVVAQVGVNREGTKINDVMVIRHEGDQLKAYSVNLQSKNVFTSPVYYMQQNDIIYLKPRGFKLSQSGSSIMSFIGLGMSIANIMTTIYLWSSVKTSN